MEKEIFLIYIERLADSFEKCKLTFSSDAKMYLLLHQLQFQMDSETELDEIFNSSDFNKIDYLIKLLENFFQYIEKEKISSPNLNQICFLKLIGKLLIEYGRSSDEKKYFELVFSTYYFDLQTKIKLISQLFRIIKRVDCDLSFLLIHELILDSLSSSRICNTQERTRLLNSLASTLLNMSRFISEEKLLEQVFHLINELKNQLNQRVDRESVLDLITSLLHQQSSLELQQKLVKMLKKLTEYGEFMRDSMLNLSNGLVRKKARFVALKLQYINERGWQVLEILEETQVHLVKPQLDSELVHFLHETNFLGINPLEVILKRMFDHSNKAIKRYALNFISQKCSFNNQLHFVSQNFLLKDVLLSLQDNLIYGEGVEKGMFTFLVFIPMDKLIRSLLSLEGKLSPFALYYILRELADASTANEDTVNLTAVELQNFANISQAICYEKAVRVELQLYMLICIIRRNQSNQNVQPILYWLGAMRLDELCVYQLKCVQQVHLNIGEIKQDSLLLSKGLARYLSLHKNQLIEYLQKSNILFQAEFLENLFSSLQTIDDSLGELIIMKFPPKKFIEQYHILSIKELSLKLKKKLSSIFIEYLENSEDSFQINQILNLLGIEESIQKSSAHISRLYLENLIVFNFKSDHCWKSLICYVRSNSEILVKSLSKIFPFLLLDNPFDKLLEMIFLTPISMNHNLINFFGALLDNEIKALKRNQIFNDLVILPNFSRMFEALSNSCLELHKKESFNETLSLLITQFAFAKSLLIHNDKLASFISFDDLEYAFNSFLAIESFEVHATLISHICLCISSLKNHEQLLQMPSEKNFFLRALQMGITFERAQVTLMDLIVDQIALGPYSSIINGTLNPKYHLQVRLDALTVALNWPHKYELLEQIFQYEQSLLKQYSQQNFPNSHIHRQQTKLWQFIALLLLQILNSDEDSSLILVIYEYTIKCVLDQSASQLSVKYLQTLILIQLLRHQKSKPFCFNHFVELLRLETDGSMLQRVPDKSHGPNKIGFFQTFLSVIYHLLDQAPEWKFFPISCLLSCHHYKVRLFSHLALEKIGATINVEIEQNKNLQLIPVPRGAANFSKNLKKIREDWFFNALDVKNDLTLYFWLNRLPQLTSCFPDDIIPLEKLLASKDLIKICDISLDWQNSKLLNCDQSKLFDRLSSEMPLKDEQDELDRKEIFQRKTQVLQLTDTEMGQSRQTKHTELIICASLLDRAPNLGGLTRTCEIFGASKLILPNLSFIQDKEFLQLSVSAQKWVKLEEVSPYSLVSYLTQLRDEHGYKLVGVEQTTGSQCLTKFSFPSKTLLLLGNEREGMPIELLQMMDYCVEIPQAGHIRSLNVHVTGAICIWEHYKQHLI